MQSLLDRRLPLRTRLDLLRADLRRKWAKRELYGVRYGPGTVYLSDADFAIDRASFTFAVTEANYATDYDGSAVLDAGGHKGYFAAYATAHGARAVVSYEPETANLEILERAASGYRDAWEGRRAAVDARAGRADLHVMRGSSRLRRSQSTRSASSTSKSSPSPTRSSTRRLTSSPARASS
jgi:FkbM family methyltransferase